MLEGKSKRQLIADISQITSERFRQLKQSALHGTCQGCPPDDLEYLMMEIIAIFHSLDQNQKVNAS